MFFFLIDPPRDGGELPINGLMGMCRWMGSHFHDRVDYKEGCIFNRVPDRVTTMGSQMSGFGGKKKSG